MPVEANFDLPRVGRENSDGITVSYVDHFAIQCKGENRLEHDEKNQDS